MEEMRYTISDAAKMVNVESHVLRYWEEQVPFLSPKKDFAGRRVYSAADIQLIQRLNYLIEKRKFTLQGACNEIIRENLSGNNTEIKSVIGQVKGELITLYKIVSKYTDKNDDPETPENGMIK